MPALPTVRPIHISLANNVPVLFILCSNPIFILTTAKFLDGGPSAVILGLPLLKDGT